MRSLLREPLLHFALLGTLVFLLHHAVTSSGGGSTARDGRDPHTIVIDDAFVGALVRDHQVRTGRVPDAAGRRSLLASFLRDEALHREARALGLDAGDTIVRRRLVQKMELVLEGTVEIAAPTTAQLERWLREHADDYRVAPRMSLTHLFFSRERRHAQAEPDARAALATLASRRAEPAHAPPLGDPFLLGADLSMRDRRALAGTFGSAFAERVVALPDSPDWQGPIESSYGWHLVRVTGRAPGGVPALDAIRARVASDWREGERARASAEAIARLVASYRVERVSAPSAVR